MVEFLDHITFTTLLLSKSLTDEIKIRTLGNAEFFTVVKCHCMKDIQRKNWSQIWMILG